SNPDIVIVPEFKLLTIQVLAYKWLVNKNIKVISMCDDSLDMVENGKDFTFIHTIARKVVVPFLDDLILVNDKVRDWYQQHYKKGIWMPIIRDEQIELPLYRSALRIAKEFETKFNLQNQKILLYVGRLVDVKNIPTLIKAIDMTKAEFTTVIVGDGPLKEDLRLLANQTEKKILFVGRFDDDYIRAWFDLADVFILPSTREAFGAVTNEALLGGCYTLLSKACGSSCLIDLNNGRLFDPESPEELAAVIDETFNNISKDGSKSNNLMNLTFQNAVVNVIKQLKR
ncbi:MAG: glycosyltransferase family 4 protein, partial [Muribaculaceae bacterium]|nr:glycosyltransferase family 4 protein [Muribaculaceae bacterium]